jgi:hypothetical protein
MVFVILCDWFPLLSKASFGPRFLEQRLKSITAVQTAGYLSRPLIHPPSDH